MKRVIIFFGEMGSGKSWAAEAYAIKHFLPWLEGDGLLTKSMLEKVRDFKSLDRQDISVLTFLLLDAVYKSMDKQEDEGFGDLAGLVMSQALYIDECRLLLDKNLKMNGYQVEWVWVKTPFIRNMKQLLSRPDGWRWVMYWLMSKPFFQKPTHAHSVLRDGIKELKERGYVFEESNDGK